MGIFDKMFNTKKTEEISEKRSEFLQFYTRDDNLDTTLKTIENLVASENYIFGSEEDIGFYLNDNLVKSIKIGHEVTQLKDYLSNSETYKGIELNQDVLKTSVIRFLNAVDYDLFYAFMNDLESSHKQVLNTPSAMLKYIVEERGEKLEREFNDLLDLKLEAFKLFELDLLVQRADNTDFLIDEPKKVEFLKERFRKKVDNAFNPDYLEQEQNMENIDHSIEEIDEEVVKVVEVEPEEIITSVEIDDETR